MSLLAGEGDRRTGGGLAFELSAGRFELSQKLVAIICDRKGATPHSPAPAHIEVPRTSAIGRNLSGARARRAVKFDAARRGI